MMILVFDQSLSGYHYEKRRYKWSNYRALLWYLAEFWPGYRSEQFRIEIYKDSLIAPLGNTDF